MDDLLHVARRMMLHAHAPYSKFHVGAAVRGEDGSIHGGCNVENSAYPQGLCAEASAIAALVSAGCKRILECVVIGPGPEVITPCGPDGLHRTVTLGQLLPMSFGPHHLAKP